jgi:hypothetical protein
MTDTLARRTADAAGKLAGAEAAGFQPVAD